MAEEKTKEFMKIAMELAQQGKGRTHPNPAVGCVIVKNGKVIGKGFHKKAGQNHAEIEALINCKQNPRGAEMYVTLEPCCHFGKTPPCTQSIIRTGIAKVFFASRDPNPKVSGKVEKELHKAGVQTEFVKEFEKESRKLNEDFEKFITTGMPFVCIKTAMSLDGKIATNSGSNDRITGESANNFVQKMRNEYSAIIVGANTVRKDNPRLTCRLKNGRNPLRVIVDSKLRVNLNANVFADANCIVGTTKKAPKKKIHALEEKGIHVFVAEKKGKVNLRKLMKFLAKKGYTSVICEGGGELNAEMLSEKLVDKIVFFYAPIIIGGRNAKTAVEGKGIEGMKNSLKLKKVEMQKIGEDLMIEGHL